MSALFVIFLEIELFSIIAQLYIAIYTILLLRHRPCFKNQQNDGLLAGWLAAVKMYAIIDPFSEKYIWANFENYIQ